jgi:hypothetical protein
MIGVFKKNISYQNGCIIYDIYIGEHRDYEFLKQNIPSHILKCYINDGTLELFQANEEINSGIDTTPIQLEIEAPKESEVEIMYKTTQSIQDKDGSEIEVGTQLTQKELKEKGFTKKKLEALIQEEKVMEVKIVK